MIFVMSIPWSAHIVCILGHQSKSSQFPNSLNFSIWFSQTKCKFFWWMFDGQNWNLVSIKKHYILKLKTFISRELLDVDHLNFYQLKEKKGMCLLDTWWLPNLLRSTPDLTRAWLLIQANWGNYFSPLHEPNVHRLFPNLVVIRYPRGKK